MQIEVRILYHLSDIVNVIKLWTKWVGHVLGKGGNKVGGNTTLGLRELYSEGMECIELPQNRIIWLAFVKDFMKLGAE